MAIEIEDYSDRLRSEHRKKPSRRFARIVLEQAAEFLMTLDGTTSYRNRRGFWFRGRRQCTIIPSLVRAVLVVKGFEPLDDVPQMTVCRDDGLLTARCQVRRVFLSCRGTERDSNSRNA